MRYLIVFFPFLLSCTSSFSQTIDITVGNLQNNWAILSSLSGEKVSRIDSVPGTAGKYTIFVGSKISHPGFYRLSFDRTTWVDFLVDGEDIRLVTDASNILDSMKVVA